MIEKCEHGINLKLTCLACARKKKDEKTSREKAIERIKKRVEKLDW
jgi:hypothetical protein